MAQVVIADTSTGTVDGTTLDITHIVAAGEVLFVGVLLEVTDAGKEVDTVTWDQGGGDQASLSLFAAFNPTHTKMRLEVWQLTNPVAKTATVRIVLLTDQKYGAVCVSTTNTDTTTPLSGSSTDEGTDTTGSLSVTQGANDLAFVFAGHFKSGGDFAPGGGETEHHDFSVEASFKMWAASEDGSGATILSWSKSPGAEHSTLGFNINEASAGGGPDRAGGAIYKLDPIGSIPGGSIVRL